MTVQHPKARVTGPTHRTPAFLTAFFLTSELTEFVVAALLCPTHYKIHARKRTRECQSCPFCFCIFYRRQDRELPDALRFHFEFGRECMLTSNMAGQTSNIS